MADSDVHRDHHDPETHAASHVDAVDTATVDHDRRPSPSILRFSPSTHNVGANEASDSFRRSSSLVDPRRATMFVPPHERLFSLPEQHHSLFASLNTSQEHWHEDDEAGAYPREPEPFSTSFRSYAEPHGYDESSIFTIPTGLPVYNAATGSPFMRPSRSRGSSVISTPYDIVAATNITADEASLNNLANVVKQEVRQQLIKYEFAALCKNASAAKTDKPRVVLPALNSLESCPLPPWAMLFQIAGTTNSIKVSTSPSFRRWCVLIEFLNNISKQHDVAKAIIAFCDIGIKNTALRTWAALYKSLLIDAQQGSIKGTDVWSTGVDLTHTLLSQGLNASYSSVNVLARTLPAWSVSDHETQISLLIQTVLIHLQLQNKNWLSRFTYDIKEALLEIQKMPLLGPYPFITQREMAIQSFTNTMSNDELIISEPKKISLTIEAIETSKKLYEKATLSDRKNYNHALIEFYSGPTFIELLTVNPSHISWLELFNKIAAAEAVYSNSDVFSVQTRGRQTSSKEPAVLAQDKSSQKFKDVNSFDAYNALTPSKKKEYNTYCKDRLFRINFKLSQNSTTPVKEFWCTNCNTWGTHKADSCNKKSSSSAKPASGHTSTTPHSQSGSAPSHVKCFNCGLAGHVAKDCSKSKPKPKPQQGANSASKKDNVKISQNDLRSLVNTIVHELRDQDHESSSIVASVVSEVQAPTSSSARSNLVQQASSAPTTPVRVGWVLPPRPGTGACLVQTRSHTTSQPLTPFSTALMHPLIDNTQSDDDDLLLGAPFVKLHAISSQGSLVCSDSLIVESNLWDSGKGLQLDLDFPDHDGIIEIAVQSDVEHLSCPRPPNVRTWSPCVTSSPQTSAHVGPPVPLTFKAPPAVVASMTHDSVDFSKAWDLCNDPHFVDQQRVNLAALHGEIIPVTNLRSDTDYTTIIRAAAFMGCTIESEDDLQQFIDRHGLVVDNSCTFHMTSHESWVPDHDNIPETFITGSNPGYTIGKGLLNVMALTSSGDYVDMPNTRLNGSRLLISVQPTSSFNIISLKDLLSLDGVQGDMLRVDPVTRKISNTLFFHGEELIVAEYNGLTYIFVGTPSQLQSTVGGCFSMLCVHDEEGDIADLVDDDLDHDHVDSVDACLRAEGFVPAHDLCANDPSNFLSSVSGGDDSAAFGQGGAFSEAKQTVLSTLKRSKAAQRAYTALKIGDGDAISLAYLHKLMLHCNPDALSKLVEMIQVDVKKDLIFCDSCVLSKITRAKVGKHELGLHATGFDIRHSKPCSFIVLDLMSLCDPSISGVQHVLGWSCPVTMYIGAEEILGKKSNVILAVDKALKRARQASGYTGTITVYSDNDSILKSVKYLDVLHDNNAIDWHSLTYESRTNPFSERPLRSMQESSRAVMLEGFLPPSFALIVLKHCAYLLNDIPRKRLGWATPRQRFEVGNKLPNLVFVRQPGIFGITFNYAKSKTGFGSKFAARGRSVVYLGVGEAFQQSGYLVLDIKTGKLFTCAGAKFDDSLLPFKEGLLATLLDQNICKLNEMEPLIHDDFDPPLPGMPRGKLPDEFVGRFVERDFLVDSDYGRIPQLFRGNVHSWELLGSNVVFNIEYDDGDSEQVYYDSSTNGKIGLTDILIPDEPSDRTALAINLGFKDLRDVYDPFTLHDDQSNNQFYETLIALAANGSNTPRHYVRLLCFAATNRSPTSAAVRKRLAAFQRYGAGKLSENTYTSLKAACRDGNSEGWDQALAVEWRKMCDAELFVWAFPPDGAYIMSLTTPCRLKHQDDLHGQSRRVRIAARGDQAIPPDGEDSFESFSPVISTPDLLLFLNIAINGGQVLMQQDLVGGYMHAPAPRPDMYYHPPKFLEPPEPGMVLLARKSIYGDPCSGRSFFLWWVGIMQKLNFKSVDRNECWWRRQDDELGEIMVATIVDDSAIAFQKRSTFDSFQNDLKLLGVKFDAQLLTSFGGFNIDYDVEKGVMKLNQSHLIEIGALRFGINDSSKLVLSPMDERLIISRDDCPTEHASDAAVSTHRCATGTAGYVAQATRHALRYAVSTLSRVADNPSKLHLKAAIRMMTYLFQTRKVPLVFTRYSWIGPDGVEYKSGIPYSWADASLAATGHAELKRSYGGFVIMINGAVFSSRSGLQHTTADSSAKAEVVEVYNCSRELVNIESILNRIDRPLNEPIILNEDSSSAITILNMTGSSKQSRHFEIKWFWVFEMIDAGVLQLKKCDSKLMLADIMTKPLSAARFRFIEYWLQGLHALSADDVRAFGYEVPDVC